MTLYPTPARLNRLRDVADGEVHRYLNGEDYAYGHQKVTSVMAAMRREGWVELGESGLVKAPWRLTESGKAVLVAAEAKESDRG